jgi:cystathionine beta-lyase/cystathionine gamma-synthase
MIFLDKMTRDARFLGKSRDKARPFAAANQKFIMERHRIPGSDRPNWSEILNHLGEDRADYFHAVAPPVVQSSNFAFPDLKTFRESFADELNSHVYSRGNNPTVAILRKKLAALEHTEDALVFASGAGAIAAAVIGNVAAGDHIVCQKSPYSWTAALLRKFLPRFGVSHTFVDGSDMAAIEAALRPNTRVLFLESPNTLTFECQDLAACAALAKARGIVSVIDNSYCSPVYQNPADFGIDIVTHSGTKYLNGHSDVVVGALCASAAMVRKLFESELMTLGGVLSPHDAALVIRGLRTLPLRVQRSHESASALIARMEQHPRVERIWYPFHHSFPQLALAQRQMRGCGGLFSAQFRADSMEKMEAFLHRVRRFLMAVSWGGHESLMIPTIGFYNIPGRSANPPLPWNFVRFYVGLEDPDWLWEDLEQALAALD